MQLLSYTRFLFQNSGYFQSCRKHSFNCTHFIKVSEIKMYSTGIRNFNRGRFYSRFIMDDRHHKLYNLTYANILVHSVKAALKKMPVLLKGHSMNIVKHCAEQCEFIIAHRIRRSQQIISLYTKLWDEMALKHFVSKLRRKFIKRGKLMLLSIGLFNWDKERISTEEVESYQNELEVIKELKRKKYCTKKGDGKCDCFNCLEPGELEWNTFVEKENLIVWKKEESNHKGEGLYCYKMYGRYDDVTALDFLEAQVDLDYRLTWDDHAVKLKTIDTERSSRSDVIYWETKWPALFSNRDYVFKRRYHIDQKRKTATLVNKSTEHPTCPPYPNKQRITEYWSYMVIKPYEDLDKPGIEFSLTYFDNPGISMPSSLSTYVTVTGMPLFLKHLHDAAIKLKDVRKTSILFDNESPDEKRSSDGKKKPPSSADDSPSSRETKKKCPKLPDLPKTNFQRLCDSFFFF